MITKWAQRLNPLVNAYPPSGIRKFFDMATEIKDIISLGVGEPDFVTPWHIREASIHSLEMGYTMYTSNQGLSELREEITRDLDGTYGVTYDARREILITVGASEGMDLAMRALLSPGEEVLIPDPAYVSYGPVAIMAGGVPVYMPTSIEHNFRLTPETVEKSITPKTKILLLCYPNNPTGAIMSRRDLQDIAEIVAKHDLLVFSDEIYDRLTYNGEHTCFSSLPGMRERTVLFNGFSKAYAMTGWRIGYVAGNADFIAAMNKIHQYTMLCAPIMAQKAAIEALRNGKPAMRRMIQEYNRRRHVVIQAFKDMGLPCFEPGGAFYAFPDITGTGLSSEEFCEQFIKEESVAVVPGNAFGPSGNGYIRCSYAASMDDLMEAFRRMNRFVKKHGVRPKTIIPMG